MSRQDSNVVDQYDNTVTVLNGQTDNTPIGNVVDRLKVDANISGISGGFPTFDAAYLVYDDMTYPRDTILPASFTSIYSYTGSGSLVGFNVNFDDDSAIYCRINIDGNYIFFGTTGVYLEDLTSSNIYDVKSVSGEIDVLGLALYNSMLRFNPKYPITYSTNVTIEARTTSLKKFKAGYVLINKVT